MTQLLKKGSMRKFGLGFAYEVPWDMLLET
jgi:hypothetical protein